MIYPVVPFPVTLSDPYARFQGHFVTTGYYTVLCYAFDVLCAQLMRDLFAIAKFLLLVNYR